MNMKKKKKKKKAMNERQREINNYFLTIFNK